MNEGMFLCAITLLVLLSCSTTDGSKGDYSRTAVASRSKREAAGLFAFPRTGRAGDCTWADSAAQGCGDHAQRTVRAGLFTFPRIGRGGHERYSGVMQPLGDAVGKRGGNKETDGIWFGPRLGRRNKRAVQTPWALITLKEIPSNRRHDSYTPRLGRESNEEDEESLVDEETEDLELYRFLTSNHQQATTS